MSIRFLALILPLFMIMGCSPFGSADPEVAPTPTYAAVPTFTPTVAVAVATKEAPAPEEDDASGETDAQSAGPEADVAQQSGTVSETNESILTNLLPTPTPAGQEDGDVATDDPETIGDPEPAAGADEPSLVVVGELVNVRQGPGVGYPVVGSAAAGEAFTIAGRNEAADWWQVCCFGETPGWLYAPLVDVQRSDAVALATDIPPLPTPAPAPEPAEEIVAAEPEPPQVEEVDPPAEVAAPVVDSGTAGVFDPEAQYHVIGYRVRGYGENNGGLFNNGAQHMIFINVVDANGNGIDGVVVKNAINDNINVVTGPKGPGRAEFEMFWDPYKLYVASDPSGPVTSQVTNQMNTAYPHIPDIVGRLGPVEEEYAICPTLEDRCEPPFYHAHWSYEVTFQKVK